MQFFPLGTCVSGLPSVAHPHEESKTCHTSRLAVAPTPTQEPTETGSRVGQIWRRESYTGDSDAIFQSVSPSETRSQLQSNKGRLASRYNITVVHDMCINICSRWVCLPWLTGVLMVHYCVKQIRNSTLALYSNLLKMSTKRILTCIVICNSFWVLRAVGWIWNVVLCKSQFVCTGS